MSKLAPLALLLVSAACLGPRPPEAPGPVAAPSPIAPPPAAAPTGDAPWQLAKVDWSKPPSPGPEPTFAPPVPKVFRLANGAAVLVIENRRLPLVSLRAVFHRAGSREDGATSGLAALTADLLDEGAGRFDAQTLPEELERLGARLEIGAAADTATIYLDTLSETLAPSIDLLADIILRPKLAAADFERIKGDRRAELALRPDRPREVAALVFEQQLFGKHPYAPPGNLPPADSIIAA